MKRVKRMKRVKGMIVYGQLVGTLLAATTTATAAAEMPAVGREVGQVFPQVVLPRLDGKGAVALSEFRGKKVLLIEFASW